MGWPFQYIWGAGLSGLGLLLVAVSRFAPGLVWDAERQGREPRVDVIIAFFAAAIIYARVVAWRAQRTADSQAPPGPAA
jgi:hypothetical protein